MGSIARREAESNAPNMHLRHATYYNNHWILVISQSDNPQPLRLSFAIDGQHIITVVHIAVQHCAMPVSQCDHFTIATLVLYFCDAANNTQ